MGMLDLVRTWLQIRSERSQPRRRLRQGTIEQLEFRRMLSPVLVGSTLTVNAATGAPISVTQNLSGTSVTVDSANYNFVPGINVINVLGSAASDQITINSILGGTALSVNGGGGNNTLISPSQANVWTVSGPNAGTLNGNSFSNIQNLTGGGFSDDFQLQNSGFVAGHIDGSGGINILDYGMRNYGAVVNLETQSATAVGAGFTNITDFNGGTDNTDLLIGMNASNVWDITSGNSGTINGTFAFKGVENLTGGTADDRFVFLDGRFFTRTPFVRKPLIHPILDLVEGHRFVPGMLHDAVDDRAGPRLSHLARHRPPGQRLPFHGHLHGHSPIAGLRATVRPATV